MLPPVAPLALPVKAGQPVPLEVSAPALWPRQKDTGPQQITAFGAFPTDNWWETGVPRSGGSDAIFQSWLTQENAQFHTKEPNQQKISLKTP